MKILRTAPALALGLLTLFATPLVSAQQQEGEGPAPDVTIRQEDDRTVKEYRINGQLYAIEIVPAAGPSYYLIDRDGNGNFERADDANRVVPPSWVLIRW
ncbi:DUF2782 domain-containing protein [Halomonas sp. WWR20]